MVIMHVWFFGFRRHLGLCRQNLCETFFLLLEFFCLVGTARHHGPSTSHLAVEVFNVVRWLTHGDLGLKAQVDFVAVV